MSQTTAASSSSKSSSEHVPCPRCKEPLIDPKGLGWCRACGYCRSLEETEKKVVVTGKPTQPVAMPPSSGPPVSATVKWLVVMVLGIILIAGATYAGGRVLKLTPLERALLTTLQIGAGRGW